MNPCSHKYFKLCIYTQAKTYQKRWQGQHLFIENPNPYHQPFSRHSHPIEIRKWHHVCCISKKPQPSCNANR